MRTLASAVLAGALVFAAGAARAEDTTKKVGKGAEQSGKTVVHGTSAVGKGGSKIYHDLAGKTHKLIARNSKSSRTRAKHMEKATIHHEHAGRKAEQSKKAMNRAEKAADKIVP
jgi:hypothetical protein